MVTITGSFLSAACCFWQPETNSAATQVSSSKVFGQHAGRSGKDGKADDVAFLLMVPSARGSRSRQRHVAAEARIIDRPEKETVSARRSTGWSRSISALRQAQSTEPMCRLEENLK
ncbi:hypothetical protein [Mesorhizobium sp. WSM3862]|uniref:hypothetical protein n=1 Tax=Mesorhizobium sp. WSM3862 TaxID=632858 RepID=UPI001FE1FDC3|nr:hypothetical protein [Mesorhizobium sp. WSM3862]